MGKLWVGCWSFYWIEGADEICAGDDPPRGMSTAPPRCRI